MSNKDFLDTSYQEGYSNSTDFVEIDHPPTPLETPDMSQICLASTNTSAEGSKHSATSEEDVPTSYYPIQTPSLLDARNRKEIQFHQHSPESEQQANPFRKNMHHRRMNSTNYKDALQLKRHNSNVENKLRATYSHGDFNDLNRNGEGTAIPGDTMCSDEKGWHHVGKDDGCLYTFHVPPAADSADDRQSISSKNRDPLGIEVHNNYKADTLNRSQSYVDTKPEQGPQLYRRNSFQYEDYKKHIYNRLNMFND